MVKLIFRLKNMAIERGICPEVIINRDTELSKSGYSFKPNDEVRKKLGLPPITCADPDQIACMVCGTGVEKAKECKEIKE
jgi:hypothetical protein